MCSFSARNWMFAFSLRLRHLTKLMFKYLIYLLDFFSMFKKCYLLRICFLLIMFLTSLGHFEKQKLQFGKYLCCQIYVRLLNRIGTIEPVHIDCTSLYSQYLQRPPNCTHAPNGPQTTA